MHVGGKASWFFFSLPLRCHHMNGIFVVSPERMGEWEVELEVEVELGYLNLVLTLQTVARE